MENTIEMNEAVVVEKAPLQVLVDKLQEQNKAKRDIIIPADSIQYTGGLIQVLDSEFTPTELCHQQIGDKLGIPRAYYKKMQTDASELLEANINGWLSKKTKTQYLLRNFQYDDQKICRAMLSNRYNMIDNFDVLIAALDAIKNMGIHVEIQKAEVTDNRMYLHIVAPEIHTEATNLLDGYLENRNTAVTGRGIISGMIIANSEVGMGQFEISARAQILQCKNGMHDRNAAFKRKHLGAKLEEGDITWSQNTKNKNYELIIAQTQDAVKKYLSQEYLGQLTDRLYKAKQVQIEHPVEAVTLLSNDLQITDDHKNAVLRYFLQDGDSSSLGLLNAVTRTTQHMNADLQYDIESQAFALLPDMKKYDVKMSTN